MNKVKNEFFIRLREARRMMGLSMQKLADKTGGVVSKQCISRYEAGAMYPRSDILISIAKALDISEEYFFSEGVSINMPALRSTASRELTADEQSVIEARISFWIERYMRAEQCADFSPKPFVNPLVSVEVKTKEQAINAANAVRETWHQGDGPIPSILRLLERKSIVVMADDLSENILGLSTWTDTNRPLIVLETNEKKTTVERLRFTAAHELAHLLLTFPDDMEKVTAEKLCNAFAGFFLLPRETFIEEIGAARRDRLVLEELVDLKDFYGISVSALVHNAYDIGMISREHYDWWYDENIKKNPKEVGWGSYMFPETLGREKRVRALVNESNQNINN